MKLKLLVIGLFMSIVAVGQDTDSTTINLDEIVIAENRIQLPFAEQSRSIALLNRELLQKILI
jgi:iron complex outermembrane receptor protein